MTRGWIGRERYAPPETYCRKICKYCKADLGQVIGMGYADIYTVCRKEECQKIYEREATDETKAKA
jgi:hypothetical protein